MSVNGIEKFEDNQGKKILQEAFKKAVKNPNFDFEACSLKYISTKDDYNESNMSESEVNLINDKNLNLKETNMFSTGKDFLLFHTQVYGGSRSPEEHVNYLLDAERIINENLKPVLKENKIESEPIFRQYIYIIQKMQINLKKLSQKDLIK